MKSRIGPCWAWAIGLWLMFGIIGCEESSTEVNVAHPDTLFVVGLTCPDTAFVTLPPDTIFVQGCPPGYHWHAWRLRCHREHHGHHHDGDDPRRRWYDDDGRDR